MLRPALRYEIRRLIQMWPDLTTITANVASTSVTTITVADGTLVAPGALLQIDNEIMRARSIATNVVTVLRGDRGTTAATHTSGATVTIYNPHDVTDLELNDFIRDGFNWLWPVVWKEVWDTSLAGDSTVVTYTIPLSGGLPIVEELYDVWIENGAQDEQWFAIRAWSMIDSKLRFPLPLSDGRRIKLHGGRRFTAPTDEVTALDLDDEIVPAIKYFAAAQVMKQHEQKRPRFTGQSALLEARSGNVPEIIGSSRESMQIATAIRAQHGRARPLRLRQVVRGA